MAVQPFRHATGMGERLGGMPGQAAVELCDGCTFVVGGAPFIRRPIFILSAEDRDHTSLVLCEEIQKSLWRLRRRSQHEVLSIDVKIQTCRAGRCKCISGAHSRAPQPPVAVSSGPD